VTFFTETTSFSLPNHAVTYMFFGSAGANRSYKGRAHSLFVLSVYVFHIFMLHFNPNSLPFFTESRCNLLVCFSAGADRGQGSGAFIIRIIYVCCQYIFGFRVNPDVYIHICIASLFLPNHAVACFFARQGRTGIKGRTQTAIAQAQRRALQVLIHNKKNNSSYPTCIVPPPTGIHMRPPSGIHKAGLRSLPPVLYA